ncbi:DUF4393 domain-containing protein [Lactobacillus sp. ESL0230]|uniref:DUF4393 domain-containing protein n=1 Tax=Lactobacillus sp. ESL0230 TaxID=2069353 RepID=UPI000EFADC80|nr:DUF4393 domain-containing protein [Lactobacillus sp. ESL0230]RMC46573.1 DUF4393 domain-containing protein [Lactobacillus sp. ESL0230]
MDPENPLNFLPQNTQELLMNPTAKNIGDTLGGISELLLSPFNIVTTWTNAHIRKFKQSIIDNVNKIPEENRDFSKLNLAMKTIEDSKYQISDDNLREMFAKLIAASVDKNQNQNLSPRFSNILSQLSPSDAKLLKQLSFNPPLPIPTVSYTLDMGSKIEYPIFEHRIGINYSKKDIIINEAGLDTLTSLGIVRLRDNFEIPEASIQKFYKEMKYAEYPMQSIDGRAERDMKIVNGIIQFTTFGETFINTVI